MELLGRSNFEVAIVLCGIGMGLAQRSTGKASLSWPLPSLRSKRAASGGAGLRYESGQGKTNHALMSKTSAGRPQPEAIPLNI